MKLKCKFWDSTWKSETQHENLRLNMKTFLTWKFESKIRPWPQILTLITNRKMNFKKLVCEKNKTTKSGFQINILSLCSLFKESWMLIFFLHCDPYFFCFFRKIFWWRIRCDYQKNRIGQFFGAQIDKTFQKKFLFRGQNWPLYWIIWL